MSANTRRKEKASSIRFSASEAAARARLCQRRGFSSPSHADSDSRYDLTPLNAMPACLELELGRHVTMHLAMHRALPWSCLAAALLVKHGGCQWRMTAAPSRTGGAIAIRNELLCTPRSQRPRMVVWLSRRRRFAFGRIATRSGVLVMPLCLRSAMICARRFGFFLRSSRRTPVCSGCPDRRVAIAGEGRHHSLRLSLFLCCVLSCFCKTQWVA